jgi:2-iminobutanoate/2-iminopropanoate deaminase
MCSCCKEQKVVKSDKAPKAIGPYSVGVIAGHMVYSSGQIGLDPTLQSLVEGGIEAETRQALENIKHVLEDSRSGLEKVVKTTVYLKDMNDFARMNGVYGEYFKENPPARTTISVVALPKGGAVEIEVVAIRDCDCDDEKKDCCCNG